MIDLIIIAIIGLLFGYFLWTGQLPVIGKSKMVQLIALIVIALLLLYFLGALGFIVFIACSFIGLAFKSKR